MGAYIGALIYYLFIFNSIDGDGGYSYGHKRCYLILLQVDELLAKGVNVTVYNGQVRFLKQYPHSI
jgi:hypothetical protein